MERPTPLQQDSCVNAVDVADQQTDDILLNYPHNRDYEDLPGDETDEGKRKQALWK